MSAVEPAAVTDEVLGAVADRLADPDVVARLATAPDNEDRPVGGTARAPWRAATLSEGHAGIALMFAELAAADETYRRAARAHLAAAVRAAGSPGAVGGGLMSGLAGIAVAARAVARPGDYRGLLATLDAQVREECLLLADAELARDERTGTSIGRYDLVSGLAGLARCLLAHDAPPELDAVLDALIRLARPVRVAGHTVPGWWTEDVPWVGAQPDRYHRGHFNAGLAHGIAGPLAALAVAWRAGHQRPGQADAIRTMVEWLLRWRSDPGVGRWWPNDVSLAEELSGQPDCEQVDRGAWCYGSPGVARSVRLAAAALDCPEWAVAAEESLLAVLDHVVPGDPSLCHGTAGLLRVADLMARDCTDPGRRLRLAAAAERLAEQLVAGFEATSTFGYRYTARGVVVAPDRPSFLEGAAGVALALAAHTRPGPPATGWDAVLLVG